MSGEGDRAVSSVEARAIATTTVSTTGGTAGKTAPRFIRVWDYAAARAAETHAVRCAFERKGQRLGVASLARHLRRRATSHAPRLERRRPNLKRRNETYGKEEGFKRCRRALRRRGRMHEHNVVYDDEITHPANPRTFRRPLETSVYMLPVWFAMHKPLGWGWILPKGRPGRGRGWRFVLRSIAKSAVVHDSSYNACLVLKGAESAVCKVLGAAALEKNMFSTKSFKSGRKAEIVHLLTMKNKRRVVCPALVYPSPAEDGSNLVYVHVWVHPRAEDKAMEVLRSAISQKLSGNTKVLLEKSSQSQRFDIVGEEATAILQKLAPSLDLYADRHVARGIRRFVTHDPRFAAWGVQVDENNFEPPCLQAPSQAECDETRKALRMATSEFPWQETIASDVKTYSILMINRGPVAREGFTLVIPSSWALPLWLGLAHAGARAAGLQEWAWCAQHFKRAVFPNDYVDTEVGVEHQMAETKQINSIGLLNKSSKVLRTKDVRLKEGTLPKGMLVRVTLRCPWVGQPTVGATIHAPTKEQHRSWCQKKKTRSSRDRSAATLTDVQGSAIGYVTSVSASAASVGLGSALMNAAEVKKLTEKFGRGKGKIFVMLSPPGKSVVPAEAEVVVRGTDSDTPWF